MLRYRGVAGCSLSRRLFARQPAVTASIALPRQALESACALTPERKRSRETRAVTMRQLMRRRKTNSKIRKRSPQWQPPRGLLRSRHQHEPLARPEGHNPSTEGSTAHRQRHLNSQIVTRRRDGLRPFPGNPRQHPEAQIQSLMLAKLVEIFDRRGVSFVSITQQFNTTTSMGRLTLNILLSFAQFERELIGERVRDKVAASKKKGMWMGGTVPLGYDVKDRKLVVNKAEARTVEDIYRRYLRLKSVRALQMELDAAGIRSKRRVGSDGTEHGNQQFSQGALYLLLQNRTYRGEATHKGNAYPGEHAAIVDKPLWDAVQAVLAENRVQRTTGANTKVPSLLTGVLFDEAGERLTPTWSVKKGTRYRYYVSTSLVKGGSKAPSTRRRIPAGNLETIVIERLQRLFSSRGELLDAIEGASIGRTGQGQLI